MSRFLTATGRHRRAVLAVALVLSAGYLLLIAREPSLGRRAFPAMTAVTVVCLLLAVAATARNRPTAFVVRPHVPAFAAPPQAARVLVILAFLPMGTGMAGNAVRDRGLEPFLPDQLLELTYAAALAVLILLTWRDTGVELRPDGVWQRGFRDRLVVAWDARPQVPALPPAPAARTVPLESGRGRHHVRTDAIDPRFLCAAIRHYADHPEDRAAIGTQAEYERRRPHLLGALDWSPT